MPSWKKNRLRLKADHQWKARPDHKIFVADRGAVRFDIPETWVVVPESDCVRLYDKQPPDDDCTLGVSYLRLPPMDWSELPLKKLLEEAVKETEREVIWTGEIVELRRADLEIVWREMHFIDAQERREAISRVCLGRRKLIQSLITFDFWLTDLDWCNPVWEEVLASLTLAEYVSDPTTGKPGKPSRVS
jgi:hypothetical protein